MGEDEEEISSRQVDRDDHRRARAVGRPVLPAARRRLRAVSGAGEDNGVVFVVVEKLIRIGIFLGYL